jgi:hydroxymethylpyrimidine pyrophosphatase-like HAD family hydrolase
LTKNIPVIVYNGTFIINPNTQEKLHALYFTEAQKDIAIKILDEYSIYPLVYGYINGEEKVSWLKHKENIGIKKYVNSRKGDTRLRSVKTIEELYHGKLFYFTCVGRKE